MSFHYDSGTSEPETPPIVKTELTAPIAGATIASAEFSHEDGKRLENGGVLLEARIELDGECFVHVRGNASVTSSVAGRTFSTGVSNDVFRKIGDVEGLDPFGFGPAVEEILDVQC
ncbi:MAG: hypothetical protein ACKVHE_20050 [Planctomycetales bacterium]|jgi:hypothetical protein